MSGAALQPVLLLAALALVVLLGLLLWRALAGRPPGVPAPAPENVPQTNDPALVQTLSEIALSASEHTRLKAKDSTHRRVVARLDQINESIGRSVGKICDQYLSSDDEDREKIRQFFNEKDLRKLLSRFIGSAAKHLRSAEDSKTLKRALAALSIENGGDDFRNTMLTVGHLYNLATEVGIEPKDPFKEVGALSSPEPAFSGPRSMKEILEGTVE